jgi:hypothetical protein
LAGVDLNKARNRHVVNAVVAFFTMPNGFTVVRSAEARQPSGHVMPNVFGAQRGYDVGHRRNFGGRWSRSYHTTAAPLLLLPHSECLYLETISSPRSGASC